MTRLPREHGRKPYQRRQLNRQDAKKSIADPVPHPIPEATNSLGVLAPWRFKVVALSGSRLPEVLYAITLARMGEAFLSRLVGMPRRSDVLHPFTADSHEIVPPGLVPPSREPMTA
jgi:hypothetical protein